MIMDTGLKIHNNQLDGLNCDGFNIKVQQWRLDFPILATKVHGQPLVYLDNATTATQKLLSVIEVESQYYRHNNANVHRGIHALNQRATDAFEAARVKVQQFINAASSIDVQHKLKTLGKLEALAGVREFQ